VDACVAQLQAEVAAWPVREVTIELGEVQQCEEPLSGPRYTEVGESLGLLGSSLPLSEHSTGGAAVVDDFDLDGDLDFLVGFRQAETTLYRNTGTSWEIESMDLSPGAASNTIALADIDGDGRRDLVMPGPPVLVVLNTDEGLEARTELMEWGLMGSPYVEFAPGDFDGDGDIDLFGLLQVTGLGSDETLTDHLLLNDGTGSFVTASLDGDAPKRWGFDAQIFDWGGDGDLDVWVVNDQGFEYGPNVLWENDEGVLINSTEDCACGLMQSGMGAAVGDYNNDGIPDLYGSATAINALLEGQADGTFVDVTLVTGASPLEGSGSMSWGALFMDYDNDGRQDLLVAEGDLWRDGDFDPLKIPLPLHLLRQVDNPDGRPHFESVSDLLGDDLERSWRAVIPRDFNGDGVLDILATDIVERPRLFLSDGCTEAGWLEVHVPVGSQVDVCADGVRQTQWSSTESSWGGAAIPTVHFGLGGSVEIDRLQVRLPSGEVAVLEGTLEGRRSLVVTP
jgi:hypothetical protein